MTSKHRKNARRNTMYAKMKCVTHVRTGSMLARTHNRADKTVVNLTGVPLFLTAASHIVLKAVGENTTRNDKAWNNCNKYEEPYIQSSRGKARRRCELG